MARGFRLKWTRFTFAVNSFSSSGSAVVVSHCYQLSLNFCHLLESQVKFAMGCSRKNPHPRDRRHAGNSHVRGVNGSGNPDGRGALNLKIHPRG